jgi:[acyl-carrier-protein] S-malonyltransferase
MTMAMEEGALNVRAIEVSIPYHAAFLQAGAMDFESRTSHLKISAPATPVISLIDQRLLTTPESIRQEISLNLYHPLNWFSTMQTMLAKSVTHFIECGPSTGLYRNARFIEGNFRFDSLNSIHS